MALNKDFVVKQGLQVEGTTVSSDTASGALIVAGGAGIGGNTNIQGYIRRVGPVSDTVFEKGAALQFNDSTYTDISSTGIVPWEIINYFGHPLLDTTNTNVTVTNAASVYIYGAPTTASTNLSIVNPYSIYITSGTMYIGETKGSTNTSVGQALQIAGGISFGNGIYGVGGGNLYGMYNINDSQIVTRAIQNEGQQEFPNELILLTNTNAVSTGTGALQLRNGGAGIAGNVYVGGRIVGLGTGTFLSTINAVSTETGALTLKGGLGVGQDLYARNGFYVSGDYSLTTVAGNSLQVTNNGGLGVSGTGYFGGQALFNANVNATTTASGSLIVNGGAGIGGTLWAQNIVVADPALAQSSSVAPLVVTGGVGIGQNLIIGSSISSTGTTATNALVVAGGVAIGRDLTVSGDAVIRGDLLLLGTGKQVVVNSTNTYIVDPVIEIGGGAAGNTLLDVPDVYDKGLLIHYQTEVNTLTDYRAIIGLDHVSQHFFLKDSILPDALGQTDVTKLFTTGSWSTLEAGSLILHDATTSTNPTSGALVVAGGIGVSGASFFDFDTTFLGAAFNLTTTTGNTVYVPNGGIGVKYLYAEQSIFVAGSQVLTTGTINSSIGGVFTNTFRFTNLTQSWSTDTGAVIVDGGLGVGGNTNIGGTFVTTGTAYIWSEEESANTYSGALTVLGGVGIGKRLNVGGAVHFYNTDNSFTSSGGAVIIDGGVGIAQDVVMSGALDIGQSARVGTNLVVASSATIYGTGDSESRSTGALVVAGGVGVSETIHATRLNVQTAIINSGTQSTGTEYGDLVVAGGVGIAQDTWIGGNTHILSTTTVNSTTGSGSLEVWGGVGIGGGLFVGGTINRVGDIEADKWTVNGPGLQLSTSTYTDRTSTGLNAGTAVIHSINKPNLVGTLSPTWKDIATLYLEGSPNIIGGSQAANQWALLIADGQVKIGSSYVNNGTTNSGALVVGGGIGAGGSITSGATVKGVTVQVINNQLASTSTVGIVADSQITIDTWNAGAFRTTKYIVQIIDAGYIPNRFQVSEIMVAYDGSAQTNGAYISEYGLISNHPGNLGDVDAVYNGGLINLVFTPNYIPANMSVQVFRTAITSS
jgi:hypothetical protein